MRQSKYNYNPKTCRYERTRISIATLVINGLLFCITTFLVFSGALFLHSRFFVTEKSLALQQENAALIKHHASLQRELRSIESTLVNLKLQDAQLHESLFEIPLTTNTIMTSGEADRILLADASGFTRTLDILKNKSSDISKKSTELNAEFSKLDVTSKELMFLLSAPSIQPIENAELTKLVSGFGIRINPFHKGNYHHRGADLAAPRGTSVVATGNGKVIGVKKGSSLQAGYGNYVEIDHGNGLVTRYAHLDDVTVRPGQQVRKGFTIGTVGMSGGTIAPHVHYEIIRQGLPVNPVPYMMQNLNSAEYTELLKLGNKKNQSLD